jgi:hypothetical protein
MELFILGFLAGLSSAPALRSWVVWREHRAASRAAWLAEETLKRLEDHYSQGSVSNPGDRSAP